MQKISFRVSTPQSDTYTFLLLLTLKLQPALLKTPRVGPTQRERSRPVKKPPVKTEPVPITVPLTVLTTPAESTVFVNGEERGVSNSEGKIQFEKLPLGQYSIEVRERRGYNPIARGFPARDRIADPGV